MRLILSLRLYSSFITSGPDRTAAFETPKFDLDPYYLQYRLSKNISIREEQTATVKTGELRVNVL